LAKAKGGVEHVITALMIEDAVCKEFNSLGLAYGPYYVMRIFKGNTPLHVRKGYCLQGGKEF
jgi:hypothetical protein